MTIELTPCQMGRTISHDERIGGLDCQTPCNAEPTNVLVVEGELHPLCGPHFDAVCSTLDLAEALSEAIDDDPGTPR